MIQACLSPDFPPSRSFTDQPNQPRTTADHQPCPAAQANHRSWADFFIGAREGKRTEGGWLMWRAFFFFLPSASGQHAPPGVCLSTA